MVLLASGVCLPQSLPMCTDTLILGCLRNGHPVPTTINLNTTFSSRHFSLNSFYYFAPTHDQAFLPHPIPHKSFILFVHYSPGGFTRWFSEVFHSFLFHCYHLQLIFQMTFFFASLPRDIRARWGGLEPEVLKSQLCFWLPGWCWSSYSISPCM